MIAIRPKSESAYSPSARSKTKKTAMIALKRVKTLPAMMLEVEREEVSGGGAELAQARAGLLGWRARRPESPRRTTRAYSIGWRRMGLKLGVNLGYWGIGPAGDEALEAVLAAERLGYESVWVAESYGSDVVSVLAWLAGQTKTINLGAAIMQVPARPPAAAAMAGATIDKLSGGRFLFGFGPSGPQVSEGWYGVPYAKPWGRTREYIEVVRKIVAREGPLEHHGDALRPAAGGRRGQGAEAEFPPAAQRDPGLRRRDRAQIGADDRRSRRRLDPDLLLRRPLRGDLGGAPRGGVRASGRTRADLEVSPSLRLRDRR